MIRVELDKYQRLIAEQYGRQRAKNFLPHFNGQTNTNYAQQNYGGDFEAFVIRQVLYVAAEMAVAKHLGFTDYLPSNTAYKNEADVGDNIEVKYSHKKDGDLLIRKRDRDSDYAVLVSGDINSFNIIGWYPIKEAKTESRSKHHLPGCYLVANAELYPLDQLIMIGACAYGYDQV